MVLPRILATAVSASCTLFQCGAVVRPRRGRVQHGGGGDYDFGNRVFSSRPKK